MKTYKVLPKVNNLKFAGRLMADPVVTKTRIAFTVIHNMGGDKPAVFRDFILFAEKVPECLKKGAPVVVNARLAADVYTNAEGKKVTRLQFIVKNVEKANVVNGVVVAGVDENGKPEGGNNLELACRLTKDPKVNEAGTRMTFVGIRNYGGQKPPVSELFVMLRKADGPAFPQLKQGDPVIVKGFYSRSEYTNAEGQNLSSTSAIARSVEPAELVVKTFKDNEPVNDSVITDEPVTVDEDVVRVIEAE